MKSSTLNPPSLTTTLWAYLQILRPANILTAWADILLGFAAAGGVTPDFWNNPILQSRLLWLLIATTGLYGGGITFNDIFDAQLDARERPERPIPSGRATRTGAILLGSSFLLGGIIAATQVSLLSGLLATAVAIAALTYNKFGKHHPLIGPLNMGLCRGGNLLLGVSAIPAMVGERYFLALIPILYIAAITAISRGEIEGGTRQTGIMALGLVGSALAGIVALCWLPEYQLLTSAPFATLLGFLVLPAFIRATARPTASNVMGAVRAGVLCLIVLDASIAAGFGGWLYGLSVLALLPISRQLAGLFAVT